MDELTSHLRRIADALERLAPPPPSADVLDTGALFVWRRQAGLLPATHVGPPLDLLLEMDMQKAAILENTRLFARGAPANNALLWGVRGVGKSALVKAAFAAVASEYPDLKLVEAPRETLSDLLTLLGALSRSEKRIVLFIDDLSFEGEEAAMKALKSALEGGLGRGGDNVIVYATSNRRHIVAREARENAVDDLMWQDTAEERLSLADRFGLWLGFHALDQDQYLRVVAAYAERFALAIPPEELGKRALQWSMSRAARSGRTAYQFVVALGGELGVHVRL